MRVMNLKKTRLEGIFKTLNFNGICFEGIPESTFCSSIQIILRYLGCTLQGGIRIEMHNIGISLAKMKKRSVATGTTLEIA
jgi:hypothetical protein